MDELARELAPLKVSDRLRVQIIAENYALEPLAARALTAKFYPRRISPASLVAQTAKAHKLRPVIRVGIRDRKAVSPRPLRKPFLADGFLVSSAGFKFLEIARPADP